MRRILSIFALIILVSCGQPNVNTYGWSVFDCPSCVYTKNYPVYFNCDQPEAGRCHKGDQHQVENGRGFSNFYGYYKNDSLSTYFQNNYWNEFFPNYVVS